MLGDCSIRVLTDCSIRVSRSFITRTHTSNATSKATVERDTRSAQWGTLCLALYAFSKIYDRVYDKASGGPLMAEGDQLWRRKLSGGDKL